MSFDYGEPQDPEIVEIRYDAETLRKVTALAARLQHEQQDTLTAEEIEAIGLEVGLQPAFIRQALDKLHEERSQNGNGKRDLPAKPEETKPEKRRRAVSTTPERWERGEVLSSVASMVVPFWWSGLAGVLASMSGYGESAAFLLVFMFFVAPVPLSLALGFLAGRVKSALVSAGVLVFTLSLAMLAFSGGPMGMAVGPVLLFSLLAYPITGTMAWWGANLRERFFPFRTATATAPQPAEVREVREERISRPALVDLVHQLQSQFESRKQHRTFLCVDVVNPWEARQKASELAVEHALRQLRGWMEQVVQSCGGESQNAGGDGTLCLFHGDSDALRAARRITEGVDRFNAEQGGLPVPFQVRCGVSGGEVVTTNHYPGYIHGSVVDRAVALQKRAEPGDVVVSGELTTVALTELGVLGRLPDAVAGEAAFSWRAGQRASEITQQLAAPA